MNHTERFVRICEDARSRVVETSIDAIAERIDSGERFSLVDARKRGAYAAGHLPGAVHLSKGGIERDIEGRLPDCEAEIVLYCGGGYRSALAADNVQRMGYTNIVSMDGGYRGWTEAGVWSTEPCTATVAGR